MSASSPSITKREAIIVYGWLIVLTLFEVALVFAPLSKEAGAILMAGSTLAKVLMIVLYFMHVKQDRPSAWLLPAIPVLLAILFVLALFPDMVFHLPLHYQ